MYWKFPDNDTSFQVCDIVLHVAGLLIFAFLIFKTPSRLEELPWLAASLLCCGWLSLALSAIKGDNNVPLMSLLQVMTVVCGFFSLTGQVSFMLIAVSLFGCLPALLLHGFEPGNTADEAQFDMSTIINCVAPFPFVITLIFSGETWISPIINFTNMDLTRYGGQSSQYTYLGGVFPLATFAMWNHTRPNRFPREVMMHIGGFLFVQSQHKQRFCWLERQMVERLSRLPSQLQQVELSMNGDSSL